MKTNAFHASVEQRRAANRARSSTFRQTTPAQVPETLRVDDLLDAYLDTKRREGGGVDETSVIENWIRAGWGDLEPHTITTPQVVAWYEGQPGAANSKNTRYGILRAVFEHGRGLGLIDENPIKLPRAVRLARAPRDGFDAASELVSLHNTWRLGYDDRIPQLRRARYFAAGMTGMRFGELAGFVFSDIEWSREPLPRLRIRRGWSRKNNRLQSTKTRRERTMPLHPALAEWIDRWRRTGWASEFGRPATDDDLVWPHKTRKDEPVFLSDRLTLRRFHDDLKTLGLAPRRFHAFRHSFISNAVSSGADERAIEAMTHPKETAPRGGSFRIYRHFGHEELCAAILNIKFEERGGQLDLPFT